MKFKLVYHPAEHNNFRAVHLESLWKEHFDIEPWNPDTYYDKSQCAFVFNYLKTSSNYQAVDSSWTDQYRDQGYRIIIDQLWDNPIITRSVREGNVLTLKACYWDRYNEALWWHALAHDQLEFNRSPDKFFLMLLRLAKPHRDRLYTAVQPYLNDCLYSYVARGHYIDSDSNNNDPSWQRHLNSNWYNSTCFSLVAETSLGLTTKWSEKIFKPIGAKQAFILWGSPGTLPYLKQLGFETFDHIIDESYDQETNSSRRLKLIIEQVDILYQQFCQGQFPLSDTITMQKLEHNFNHFYNLGLVHQMFNDHVITPLLEFIER